MAKNAPIPCSGGVVALEGLDGCGTTTQAKQLVEALLTRGVPAIQTQEPSSGVVGKIIRQALTATDEGGAQTFPAYLALLFAADRLEHLERCIRPALDRGEVVVSDRSVLSSLAYQSMELPPDWVEAINVFAPYPHLVLWLDAPVERCLERIQNRSETRERFEKRDSLMRLRPLYKSLFESERPGVELLRIDGDQTIEAVHVEICSKVQAWLQR